MTQLRKRTLVMWMPAACALLCGCRVNMFEMSVWHEKPEITELMQTGTYAFDDGGSFREGTYELTALDGMRLWDSEGAINIEIAGAMTREKKSPLYGGIRLRRCNGSLAAYSTVVEEWPIPLPPEDSPVSLHVEQTEVTPFMGIMTSPKRRTLFARGIMGFKVAEVPAFDPTALLIEDRLYMEMAVSITFHGEADLIIPFGKSGFGLRLGGEVGGDVPLGYTYGYGWKIAYSEDNMTIMIGSRRRVWNAFFHFGEDFDDYELVTDSDGLFVSATLRF